MKSPLFLHAMKQVFNIGTSEGLNAAASILLIELGETHCYIGVANKESKTLQHLVYYIAEANDNGNIIEQILQAHPEFRASFNQTIVGYYMPDSVLMPSKYYRYEDAQTMLQNIYEKESSIMISEPVPAWQLYNAYHVPTAMHEAITKRFTSGEYWHTYSLSLKNNPVANEVGNLLVDFKTESFSVIVTKGNSLLLAQIYSCNTSEDVLYQLLSICKQFDLSQQTVNLFLSGLIDKQSSVYKELYQYFLNIDFAPVNNGLQLGEGFQEYPAHFFSSIYKLASCVS